MSLFEAREWWSTWCGSADEEFDHGSLCVANIDNRNPKCDKMIVGSLNGVLRVFSAQSKEFRASDLMLETQLKYPVLQLDAGFFVSGSDQIHLAVLHPRCLTVYTVKLRPCEINPGLTESEENSTELENTELGENSSFGVSSNVEHNQMFTLTQLYEHSLDRTAYSMTYGAFGGVKGKDFISVLSMDGAVSVFEQESFSFHCHLPDFLLPGPFCYLPATDTFVFAAADRSLQFYKYATLASCPAGSDKKSSKKPTPDNVKIFGDHVISIECSKKSLVVLGEHSLLTLSLTGEVLNMKKLEYTPSCLFSYPKPDNADVRMNLVCTHSSMLLVYEDTRLVWAAKLPNVPVACRLASTQELEGTIVTLNDSGHLFCSYLGTSPTMFVAPQPTHRDDQSFELLQHEYVELNRQIKSQKDNGEVPAPKEPLELSVVPPQSLEFSGGHGENEEEDVPTYSVKILLEWTSIKAVENITVTCTTHHPIQCSHPQLQIPILGDKGPITAYEVLFYTSAACSPSDLSVTIAATYISESEAPRVVQTSLDLPLRLVAYGIPPTKTSEHKLVFGVNKEVVNLGELFPEMVEDAVIPISSLGFQYIGGPTASVLTAKQSNRYRVQAETFDGLWIVFNQLITRLQAFHEQDGGAPLSFAYQGPVPTDPYYAIIDEHFATRLRIQELNAVLEQRCQQFRVIQKRLLTRFKDKTPAPLVHLDTLLDGTYKQILVSCEHIEEMQLSLVHWGVTLSNATKLINFLTKLHSNLSDEQYEILQTVLTPLVTPEQTPQGWEETVDMNISYMVQNCLARNPKDHNSTLPSMTMAKDTAKLKRHLSLLWERLGKGVSLSYGTEQDSGMLVEKSSLLSAIIAT